MSNHDHEPPTEALAALRARGVPERVIQKAEARGIGHGQLLRWVLEHAGDIWGVVGKILDATAKDKPADGDAPPTP